SGHGNAGPAAYHRGDVLRIDLFFEEARVAEGGQADILGAQLLGELAQRAVAQPRGAFEIGGALGLLDLHPGLVDLRLDRAHLPDQGLFLIPPRPEGLALLLLIRDVTLDPLEALPRGGVGLLSERLPLD